jgi:hypothetical protein
LLENRKFRLFVGAPDAGRFINLFRNCWRQVPAEAQQHILRHWNNAPCGHWPVFELLNIPSDSAIAHAQVKGPGYKLQFDAASFQELPEPVALLVIARALAHVYLWAIRRDPQALEEDEANEDEIVENWGFDERPNRQLRWGATGRFRRTSTTQPVQTIGLPK